MLALRPEPGIAPVVVPGLGRAISPAADFAALLRLIGIFRRYRPHVVHTHMAKAGLLGRLAARIARVPVIVHTFHGNVLRGYFDPLRSRAFLALERSLARISTRIVAISPRQREEIRHLGIGDGGKLVDIPLGLDLAPFLDPLQGALRRELGIERTAPLVGLVARLVPIKGVDIFLEAAARVARRRPDARFVIAGDGELRAWLEGYAGRLGLSDRLKFLGWRADLPSVYADLDVLVLSSRNEGTPVSVIEALAARRAVVATAVGGVPDVLGDSECGLLVRAEDADAVADAVVGLLDEPERRRALGEAGRLRVYPEYDVETLLARIDALYAELVSS